MIYEKVNGVNTDVSSYQKIVTAVMYAGTFSLASNAVQRVTINLPEEFGDVDEIINVSLAIDTNDVVSDSIYVMSGIYETFNKTNRTVDMMVRNVSHERRDSNMVNVRVTGIKYYGGD